MRARTGSAVLLAVLPMWQRHDFRQEARRKAVAIGLLLFGFEIVAHAWPAPQAATGAQRAPVAVTMTIRVTDGTGAMLGGVNVRATGPIEREGTTSNEDGLRFTNLKAGTYRLRFVHVGHVTLERDVTVRAGQPAQVDVMLSESPPSVVPPSRPEPVKPAEPPPPPPVKPRTVAIPSFVEQNFIGRGQGRKDFVVGCTATGMATLLQLRDALAKETNDASDEWLYVVAGEGKLLVGESEEKLTAGTFSLIPRTITHGIVPTGRNPLILISILTGQACSQQ